MGLLIALVLTVALLQFCSPANLKNSTLRTKVQAVQVKIPQKVSAGHVRQVSIVAQEKTQTEQQTTVEPEKKVDATPTQAVSQGCDTYRDLFNQYDWPVSTAIAICEAESGGNTHALSPTEDYGLMQINQVHADMVDEDLTKLYDPATNIQVAYRIYSARGWSAWSTFESGRYLSFL